MARTSYTKRLDEKNQAFRASKINFARRDNTDLELRGQAETSLKIEDLRDKIQLR
jgi:hypothetical protein